MATATGSEGTLTVSRVIKASPQTIYRALMDPAALVSWRPPEGMKGHMYEFDPREGGTYRMGLEYVGSDHPVSGKTSDHLDIVQGRFVEIVPDKRIVENIIFESDDPQFAGTMTLTTTLTEVPGGTEVTILCQNAPEGIRPSDHEIGIRSTLKNLAAYTE